MGQSYSAGSVLPFLQPYVGCQLEEVRCKRLAFCRLLASEGGGGRYAGSINSFSITRSHFNVIFNITKPEASFKIFRTFDPLGHGSFTSLDLFGALALLSRDSLDAKLRFILSLVDFNRDNKLNPSEMTIALRCVARGVARMKKLEAPPLSRIQALVEECFSFAGYDVDESLEIKIDYAVIFLQTQQLCTSYISKLSSGVGGTGDSADLSKLEANILRDLAELDVRLHLLEKAGVAADAEEEEEEEEYSKLPTVPPRGTDGGQEIDPSVIVIRKRRSSLSSSGTDGVDMQKEAAGFEKGYRRVDAGDGGSDGQLLDTELKIKHRWKQIPHKTSYGNVRLNADLLMKLVEVASINVNALTEADVRTALQQIPVDQLGTTSLEEILSWFKSFSKQMAMKSILENGSWRSRSDFLFTCAREKVASMWSRVNQWLGDSFREQDRLHQQQQQQQSNDASVPIPNAPTSAAAEGGGGGGGGAAPIQSNIAVAFSIGHMKESKVSFHLDVRSTQGQHSTITAAAAAGTGKRSIDTPPSAAELLATEYNNRKKAPPVNLGTQVLPAFHLVLWFDLLLKKDISEVQAGNLIEKLTSAFSTFPADMRSGCKLDVVAFSHPKLKAQMLRVHLFCERDYLAEMEKQQPISFSLIKSIKLRIDLGSTLSEMTEQMQEYVDVSWMEKSGGGEKEGEEDEEAKKDQEEMNARRRTLYTNVFKRINVDKDNVLSFRDVTLAQRLRGEPELRTTDDYRQAIDGYGERKGLGIAGLVALYEQHGGLMQDISKFGLGSIDDLLTGMVTFTAELIAEPLTQLEHLFKHHSWLHMRRKLCAFVGQFTRDAYLEAEVPKISRLFPVGYTPKALVEPAWLVLCMRQFQDFLGDVNHGLIPDWRRKLKNFWGEGHLDAAASFVPEGTLQQLTRLETDVEQLRNALKQRLVPSTKSSYEEHLASSLAKIESINQQIEVAIATSASLTLQAYDLLRTMAEEFSNLSVGNSKLTIRTKLANLDLLSWLPEAKVIEQVVVQDEEFLSSQSSTRRERRRSSKEKDVENLESVRKERRRSSDSIFNQTAGGEFTETRRTSDPYEIDRKLFVKGLMARDRSRMNDAKELWTKVLELKVQRSKGVDAEAVALNNLAILMLESATHDVRKVKEAYVLIQRAVDVMQVYSYSATNPLVREDKEVYELIQEQVVAESNGLLPPSASPKNIPHPTAMAYVLILANMLAMTNSGGRHDDEETREHLRDERTVAYQKRLSGLCKYSLTAEQRDALLTNELTPLELQGLQVIIMSPESEKILSHIVKRHRNDSVTLTIGDKGAAMAKTGSRKNATLSKSRKSRMNQTVPQTS